MNREKTNDYGNLCTQMYELLHPAADEQELEFYLSYARPFWSRCAAAGGF